MKTQSYIAAFKSLPADICRAEVHLEMQTQKSLSMRDGALDSSQSFEKKALYVRATGKNTGLVYTEALSEEPLSVMRRAIENAQIVSSIRDVTFTPPGLVYPDYPRGADKAPSFEEMAAAAAGLEKKLLSLCEDARLAGCTLSYTRYADEVANSLGLAVESACGYYTLELHLLCEINGALGEKGLTLLSDTAGGFQLEGAVKEALNIARLQAAPVSLPLG